MTQLNSALFIDYDNVRSELDRYDPAVAARFSNKPLLWLDAFERHLPVRQGREEARRIVARRCYASPQRINHFRRIFVQTGFEVIDCPPLTAHLKNSADIYIVMDVVDYLQRYPHIEEFIILSADADFVPVLNRLLNTPAPALQIPVEHLVLGRRRRILTPALLDVVHRAGKLVHIWTVDDSELITQLVDAGVDGIFTDRIDTLKAVLTERELWRP